MIVTGASKGIGAATAHAVIKAGARLIAHYGNDRAGAEKATSFARDGQVTLLKSDFSNMDAVDAFWSQALKAADGYIDVLVNNAGGGLDLQPTRFFDRDPAHIAQLINTNLTGVLYCCQAFGAIMSEQGAGSIINLGSIAGLCGRDRNMYERTNLPEQPIEYAAAKAGIIGATRDLAGLLSPLGVRVNAISPGGFERGHLAREIGFDDLAVVVREREGVEHARRTEMRIALQERVDRRASAMPSPQPAHGDARPFDVRASLEQAAVATHVRMRHQHARKRR